MTKWGAATGVEVDAHDNVYVFQRNPAMPVVVFDRNGKFLRSWASDIKFGQTHFLRVDRFGDIWLTDRGDMQAFKFTPEGKLLLTIGKKGVKGDNNSQDTFNGMADVAIAKNGDFFIADGEGPNTRVVKFDKDGKFVKSFHAASGASFLAMETMSSSIAVTTLFSVLENCAPNAR